MDSFFLFLLFKEQLVLQQNGGPRKGVMQLLSEKKNKLKQIFFLINCWFFRLLTLGKVKDSQHKKNVN